MQRHLRLAMAVPIAGLIAVLAAAPTASAKPKPTTTTTTVPTTTTTEPSTTTTEPSTTTTEPSTTTTEPTLVADLSTLIDDPDNSWLYVGVYPTYPLCPADGACGQMIYFDCEGLFGPAAACDNPDFWAYWYWGG
jgi:hypothetical protein